MSQATMTTLPPRGKFQWCFSCAKSAACQFLDRSPPLPSTQPPPSWAGSGAAGTRQILKQTSRQSLQSNGKQKKCVHDCYNYLFYFLFLFAINYIVNILFILFLFVIITVI